MIKTLVRNGIFGEGRRGENEKWTLVICFNQFKINRRYRKSFTNALFDLRMYAEDDYLKRFFRRWKKTIDHQVRRLEFGKTQDELFDESNANTMTKKRMAGEIGDKHAEITDLQV